MCAIDMLGALQEQIFSACYCSKSLQQAIMTVAANRAIETLFNLVFHNFLTIIKSDIWNKESSYKPCSKKGFCLLLLLEELRTGYSNRGVLEL